MRVTHFLVRDFDHVLQLQQKISEMLRAGKLTEGYLLLGEHDPVITLGKATEPGDVKSDPCVAMSGIPIKKIGRGGRATLHNPGQLVGYLVCKIQELNIENDPTRLVRQIEDVIIQTLSAYNIEGQRRTDAPGVWVGGKKVAFLGFEWDAGQLMHGFSVNLNNDLDDFWKISPCGFDPAIITSVTQIIRKKIDFWAFAGQLQEVFTRIFKVPLYPTSYSDLLLLTGVRPPWLTVSQFQTPAHQAVQELLNKKHLDTVCESAVCPNRGECFSRHTATFLLLGNTCTRNCTFCAVPKEGHSQPPDLKLIPHIVEAVQAMHLDYVVLTSVTRDDLSDGGSFYIAKTMTEIRRARPRAQIEVLIPDFQGNRESLAKIASVHPDVLNHNVETVPRLYVAIRPQADFERSLGVLRYFRNLNPPIETKSGLMVGLGETREELEFVFKQLVNAGVHTLTIGQYLRPNDRCVDMRKYYTPEEFSELAALAEKAGIPQVFSSPLVRSSYHADEKHSRDELEKK